MTIQVTLNGNEFQRNGIIKDGKIYNGKYDSLRIMRNGNGRVYFMALSSEINGKVGTFAKQMQFENGNVIISFGKNDKMIIGSYVDTDKAEVTENEIPEQVEEDATSPEEIKPITNKFKVSKETENIIVRGYMRKVEEREGKRIEHDEFELYLVKSSKYYEVYEKNTGKSVVGYERTKKEMMEKLQEFLNSHSEKLKEAITATIEKDGHITDYEIGSWIRSA